jgi:hypothetical protein
MTWMNLENILLNETSQSEKDRCCIRYLEKSETESRTVVARCWGRKRMENYCLMDIDLQFCKMKRVLEMDDADGCTTM